MEVYETPVVKVIEVEVEKGFAVSDGNSEDVSNENEPLPWS